jgi:hypothetical protein
MIGLTVIRKLWTWNNRPLTHEDRLNSAAALHGYATDLFHNAALDLEVAASQYRELAADADAEATAKAMLAGTARSQASRANTQAARIRELIG